MNVILSEECIKQLKIIEILKNKGNKNYGMLYHQIALCVKAIESVDCIDDIPFELRYHQKNSKQIGHLGHPLEKCLSVDLDGTNRFLTFEERGKAVVVTSLGHYNVSLVENLGDEKALFKSKEEAVNDFNYDQLPDDAFVLLKEESEPTKQALLNSVKDVELTDTIIHSFDSNLKKDICPLNPDSVMCRLRAHLRNWERQYKQDNNIRNLRPEDSKVRDVEVRNFVDKYISVLERSTVNARGLSNAGAIVCGDGDFYKTVELKVQLDKYLVKSFSHLVHCMNSNVESTKLKKELFDKMCNAFLRGFDKKYDRIVEFDNQDLRVRALDKLLRKAVFEDVDNILSLQSKEYIQATKNKQTIFARIFPKFTVAVQNLKSFFSSKGQTNEADNSVESVAFPKEQEENITKKEIAESQENQSLNNQEQSLSLKRREHMNERIQKADASKEIDEETQNQASAESQRKAMMRRNMKKKNARENVVSTSQKKGRSR